VLTAIRHSLFAIRHWRPNGRMSPTRRAAARAPATQSTRTPRSLPMPRIVRGGLIQATLSLPGNAPIDKIKQSMIDKHVGLIEQAAGKGAQVICLQELFYGPYFCCEQDVKCYSMVEKIPDGPTTRLMCELAKKLG